MNEGNNNEKNVNYDMKNHVKCRAYRIQSRLSDHIYIRLYTYNYIHVCRYVVVFEHGNHKPKI